MLCENKKRVITKDMFIKCVYEYEPMSDSALNNFILRIRKKFGKNFLHTIPDVGYKMILWKYRQISNKNININFYSMSISICKFGKSNSSIEWKHQFEFADFYAAIEIKKIKK